MILLDTDICIEILRKNKKVIENRINTDDDVSISFMTVAELFYGAENSNYRDENFSLVEEFILTVPVIETDIDIMKRFAIIKSDLKRRNEIIADADILIAATTLEKCSKLVTGNTGHFERINGLVLENWIR